MRQADSNLDTIGQTVDSTVRDRFRDKQIEALNQQGDQIYEICQQLSDRVSKLELDFRDVQHKVDRLSEQEYLSHPYSLDGQAFCNYEDLG